MDKILEIIKDVLDDDNINPDDVLFEHEDWDSLAALTLISSVDEEFGVVLEADDFSDKMKIKDLVAVIKSKMEI